MKHIVMVGLCLPDAQKLHYELTEIFDANVKVLNTIEETKSFLENNNDVDLLLTSQLTFSGKQPGLDIVEYINSNNLKIPSVVFTSTEKYQRDALEKGAALAFDLDLMIAYLGPERTKQREEMIGRMKGLLRE